MHLPVPAPSRSAKSPGPPPTERPVDLLRACVGNPDDGPWRRFSEVYGPKIRRRLHRAASGLGIPLSREEAQELTQELFLRFFTCSRPFLGETDDEFWTYINRSVENQVLDLARRLRARGRHGYSGSVHVRGSGFFRFRSRFGVLGTREPDPEHRLLFEESRKELDREWSERYGKGSSPRAAALRLTLLEGWSSKETSRRLGGSLTPKQVDNTVGDWRRRLKRQGVTVKIRRGGPRGRSFPQVLPPSHRISIRAEDLDEPSTSPSSRE